MDIDDQLREFKTGMDATAEWSDVMCRIADAVEHTAMLQTLANLAMFNFEVSENPPVKHRQGCPACMMVRTAHKRPDIVQPPPNGWNRG